MRLCIIHLSEHSAPVGMSRSYFLNEVWIQMRGSTFMQRNIFNPSADRALQFTISKPSHEVVISGALVGKRTIRGGDHSISWFRNGEREHPAIAQNGTWSTANRAVESFLAQTQSRLGQRLPFGTFRPALRLDGSWLAPCGFFLHRIALCGSVFPSHYPRTSPSAG
jgi:hypothetical protein